MAHNPVKLHNGLGSRECLFLYETEDRCRGAIFQWH